MNETKKKSAKNKVRNQEEKPSLWERYLTKEIGIEFKACLYFFAFLFWFFYRS